MCPVRAVLDSGSDPTSMSDRVVCKLQACFPSVCMAQPMQGAHDVKMVDGSLVPTTTKTCPLRLALHTEWGPVMLGPFCFSVMPAEDDTILLRGATVKELGIVYDYLATCARKQAIASVHGVENPSFKGCRRVTVAVQALQQRDEDEPVALHDEAVARARSRESTCT